MAVAIKENKAVRGVKAIASRPDGTHFSFMPFPTPIRDQNGQIVGGINMLIYAGEAMSAMLPQEIIAC